MHRLEKAGVEEFESVRQFYWGLIDRMSGRTDSVGWKKGIYPSDAFLKNSLENGELYVMKEEGEILASVILNSESNEGYRGIRWGIICEKEEVLIPHALGVWPERQRQGIGAKVVQEILRIAEENRCRAVRLDLLAGNIGAKRLYEKLGFSQVEAKQMFYEDTGWTLFLMYEKNLPQV